MCVRRRYHFGIHKVLSTEDDTPSVSSVTNDGFTISPVHCKVADDENSAVESKYLNVPQGKKISPTSTLGTQESLNGRSLFVFRIVFVSQNHTGEVF